MKLKTLFLLTLFSTTAIAEEDDKKNFIITRFGPSINKGKYDSSQNDFNYKRSNLNFDKSYALGLVIGHRITPQWSAAVSFTYMPKFKITSQRTLNDNRIHLYDSYVNSLVTTVDLSHHFLNLGIPKIIPFVTLGVGMAFNEISASQVFSDGESNEYIYESKQTSLAWKIGCGLTYQVKDSVFLESSYTYLNYGKVGSQTSLHDYKVNNNDADYNKFKSLSAHQFMLGIGFRF